MTLALEFPRHSSRRLLHLLPGYSRRVLYFINRVPMLVDWSLGSGIKAAIKHKVKLSPERRYASWLACGWDLTHYESRGIFIPEMDFSLDPRVEV